MNNNTSQNILSSFYTETSFPTTVKNISLTVIEENTKSFTESSSVNIEFESQQNITVIDNSNIFEQSEAILSEVMVEESPKKHIKGLESHKIKRPNKRPDKNGAIFTIKTAINS